MLQIHNLHDEVLSLSSGTSEKYVPQPSRIQIQSDILIGLRRFKNTIRWKEFFRLRNADDEARSRAILDKAPEINKFVSTKNKKTVKDIITIPLKPCNKITQASKGSDHLENFIRDLEFDLLSTSFNRNVTAVKKSPKDKKIDTLFKFLKNQSDVVVPTDKTNSIVIIPLHKYISEMKKPFGQVYNSGPLEKDRVDF